MSGSSKVFYHNGRPTMRVLDNFVSTKELVYWQTRINEGTRLGTPFDPKGTELWAKIQEIIGMNLTGSNLYLISSEDKANLHRDPKQYSVIFYPFDSDGALATFEDDWKTMKEKIDIKSNRLVLFACSEEVHAQIPPLSGRRYSVVFKFQT